MQPVNDITDGISYNDRFSLAAEFVLNTGQNIFLTGKAGTGKTTFLKHIRNTCTKEMAIAAPTGVAAINCGGSTLHSLFQLPFGCYIPGTLRGFSQTNVAVTDRHTLFRNMRISNDKKELFANLQLLIIDEVSMLRCDMLDAIDAILKRFRNNPSDAFGGVQVVFIGDLYQLPPVVTDDEWQYLSDYYKSPFFFEAVALKDDTPFVIELDKVYRQSDNHFIHLLNRIRNNEVTEDDYSLLQSLYIPAFRQKIEDPFITLTTHNYKADDINKRELQKITSKEFVFEADVKNDFPERMFPVEKTLVLKEGTRIMFIKNDTKEKRWYNGKLATVMKIEFDEETGTAFIHVQPDDEKYQIILERETWTNIRYTWNEDEQKIAEEEIGSFTQYPIRLAWAITIHKSQGLTFEKAIIDAGGAFAAGQVYVALSRCVSLQGVVLLSSITPRAINTDERIVEYMHSINKNDDLQSALLAQKEKYFISQTVQNYNWGKIAARMELFIGYMLERQLEVKETVITQLQQIHTAIMEQKETADKFIMQITNITAGGLTQDATEKLNQRLQKANPWFAAETDEKILKPLQQLNKDLMNQKKVRKVLKAMGQQILFYEKLYNRFVPPEKRKGKRFYAAPAPEEQPQKNTAQGPMEFLGLLRRLRQSIAMKENIPPYRICNDTTLNEIKDYLPQNMNEMASIKGMGDYTLSKYGEAFLQAVLAYSKANNLESQMHLKKEIPRPAPKPAEEKINSKEQTLTLFKEGKTIAEIAQLRNLAAGTIEGHLALLVKTGEVDVMKLLSEEKYQLIAKALSENTEPGIGAVKNKLGDAASFGEIRFVLNDLERKKVASSE